MSYTREQLIEKYFYDVKPKKIFEESDSTFLKNQKIQAFLFQILRHEGQ